MATRDIRTSIQDSVCDVCGRTLLRGERADIYLDGHARREVCELCKDRALHEGWVREGTVTGYEEGHASADRRRSLLGRWRGRREMMPPPGAAPTLRDELDGQAWSQEAEARDADAAAPERRRGRPRSDRAARPARSEREPRSLSSPRRSRPEPEAAGIPLRMPRHVRAVPTSGEQKVLAAVSVFNDSEHPRTVAGVARSLGAPGARVVPSSTGPSLVDIVVWWELCWYRYEVDLSDEVPSVRQVAQGYELSELTADEQVPNTVANDRGELLLGA